MRSLLLPSLGLAGRFIRGIGRKGVHSKALGPLPYTRLPYNSAQIDVGALHVDDVAAFSVQLWETVAELRSVCRLDAVYLRVPMLYAHLIPSAALFGFKYHSAEGDIASLLLWLQPSECKVPPFATHHCGVGAAVLHKDKLLVVKERAKPTGWKLPGGYLNLGEDIEVGVRREVEEETGIKAVFERVLSFRHQHNVQFGRSDIYIICQLRAESSDIRVDPEIDEAMWMDIAEFRAQTRHPMLLKISEILLLTRKKEHDGRMTMTGFVGETMPSSIRGKEPFTLYSQPLL